MTRDDLESLGMTDGDLDRDWAKTTGLHDEIAHLEDTPAVQSMRRERFRRSMIFAQGVRDLHNPPIGPYAIDEPDIHESLRSD